MAEISSNNKRITKNTLALYTRNLLTLIIGLFTVRVVLKTLGEEDYGIYSLVGGAITFLTFISGALATGSQRFFSFALGKKNVEDLKRTFGVTFTIYFIFVFIVIAAAESIGVWFINTKLVIDSARIFAANVVFQIVILSTAVTLLSNPFMMAIMAHEDMHIFAKLAILDAVVKLSVCGLLIVSPFDKLISYSAMLLIGTILVQGIYFAYANKRYEECRLRLIWDSSKAKEITSFSVWNLFGSLAWVGKTQGISVVLNIFFGPVVNAAQGVASTVRSASSTFSSNFSSALSPQIIKKYANEDYSGMASLLHRGSKMTYFLMLIVVVPMIFCIDFILQIWVGDHSEHMAPFCKLLLLEALIDSISLPLATANQATGKIAKYQACIGFFGLLTLPVAYLFMVMGYAPEWTLIISVFFQIGVVSVRIVFLHRIYPGAVKGAMKNIFLPCAMVTVATFLLCWMLSINVYDIITCVWAVLLYVAICFVAIWVLGFAKDEREKISQLVKSKICTKFSRQ